MSFIEKTKKVLVFQAFFRLAKNWNSSDSTIVSTILWKKLFVRPMVFEVPFAISYYLSQFKFLIKRFIVLQQIQEGNR